MVKAAATGAPRSPVTEFAEELHRVRIALRRQRLRQRRDADRTTGVDIVPFFMTSATNKEYMLGGLPLTATLRVSTPAYGAPMKGQRRLCVPRRRPGSRVSNADVDTVKPWRRLSPGNTKRLAATSASHPNPSLQLKRKGPEFPPALSLICFA
ncbi:hypothetical protein ACWKWJ_15805 [Sphingopyxis terrae subsp. ummariensis]